MLRLLLAPAIVWVGAAGQSRLVAVLLVAAAFTDVLDGRLARRLGPSTAGAHLDAAADLAVMVATAVAIGLLQPAILAELSAFLAVVACLYAAGAAATWWSRHRLVDPKLVTAKLAGACLYGFALWTLATGDYEPVLLTAAGLAVVVAALNAIVAAVSIHSKATARSSRSHAPHHENGVSKSTAASASIATSSSHAATKPLP